MRALQEDTRGLSTVEYILILVIVAITALLLWQMFGSSVNSRVDQATQSVVSMDGQEGGGGPVASDTAGSATAMAITEGRQGSSEEGSAGGMGAAGGAGADGEGQGMAAVARRAGVAEGASAGFGGDEENGEAGEAIDSSTPDIFLWIGWLLVLILGAVTVFSLLGKRVGKGK